MEIKPEDELSNIVLFPVKEDDPRNQVNFLYEPSERPYCHHASVRVDEKERQVRCKICGAVVEPFDWMLSVAKRETRLNRPGVPGECFICELRLPDHHFRWKHNKLFLLLPEEYGPAFPAIVDCYTSPPT